MGSVNGCGCHEFHELSSHTGSLPSTQESDAALSSLSWEDADTPPESLSTTGEEHVGKERASLNSCIVQTFGAQEMPCATCMDSLELSCL